MPDPHLPGVDEPRPDPDLVLASRLLVTMILPQSGGRKVEQPFVLLRRQRRLYAEDVL